MLVVGTAGHIDHGKSSIVKRLSGTDPDRLPEEKDRGMTIDLGFAFFQTDTEDTIAFVDVPGHERFVKNMVAGVGGIDVVMLVIAADDGWMPQSEEHFQIVRLLKINNGLIVINKIDLAETDWLELLEIEIRDKVKGSFLEDAPILKVSSITGEGFEELQNYLNQLPEKISSQKDSGKTRLYIDRSFVRPGIGGVVTGTLRGGELSVGEAVKVWPSLESGKVRSLHSNNQDVETAVPGQRTAVSFTGIDKEFLIRGGVVSTIDDLDYFQYNKTIALNVEVLTNSPVPLIDDRQILLIMGTTEVEGRIRLYDRKMIKPGESGVIFFIPNDPLLTLIGDRYILRLPTPMVTLGGGEVIDHLKWVPRKKDFPRYDYLNQRLSLTLTNLIKSELHKIIIIPKEKLLIRSIYSASEIEDQLKTMFGKKEVKFYRGSVYLISHFENKVDSILESVRSYLDEKPHLRGLSLEEIEKITQFETIQLEIIINYLLDESRMVRLKDKYNPAGRGMSLKGPIKLAWQDIMDRLNEKPYAPPPLIRLSTGGKHHKDAVKYILEAGQGVKCGSEFIFLSEVWDEVVKFICEKLIEHDQLTIGDLKEKFGFSRKFAIPILEETDRQKLTRRDGDFRKKGINFENQKLAL